MESTKVKTKQTQPGFTLIEILLVLGTTVSNGGRGDLDHPYQ